MDTNDDKQTQAQSRDDIWDELDNKPKGTESAGAGDPVESNAGAVEATEKETKEAPAKTADATEVDPRDGLPQSVRDELAGYKAMLDATQAQLKSNQDELRKAFGKIGELNDRVKRSSSAAPRTPTDAEVRDASKSDSAMARLKEQYPDFGAALDEALAEREQAISDKLAQATPKNVATREDLDAAAREAAVEAAHPGWRDKVSTPAFQGWLLRQDDNTKALAASAKPADAIKLLDLAFKQQDGDDTNTHDRSARLKAAAVIPTRAGRTNSRPIDLESMDRAKYWDYLDKTEATKARA
jgi:hypothetical protein